MIHSNALIILRRWIHFTHQAVASLRASFHKVHFESMSLAALGRMSERQPSLARVETKSYLSWALQHQDYGKTINYWLVLVVDFSPRWIFFYYNRGTSFVVFDATTYTSHCLQIPTIQADSIRPCLHDDTYCKCFPKAIPLHRQFLSWWFS